MTLRVRCSIANGRQASNRVSSQYFARAKEYGWWLVLGDDEGDLLAVKRITVGAPG